MMPKSAGHRYQNFSPALIGLFYCVFLACTLLYWLIVSIGLVLLVIPGLIFAIRFQFSFYYIIDKKIPVLESFSKSYALTRGSFWRLLVIDGISMIILNISPFGFQSFIGPYSIYFSAITTIIGLVLALFTAPVAQSDDYLCV